MNLKTFVGFFAVVGALFAFSTSAYAIKCNGPYQVNYGQYGKQEFLSPYCEDNYLAVVAQEYGAVYTRHEIRNNPSKKKEACELVGHDNRVASNCASVLGDGGFRRQ